MFAQHRTWDTSSMAQKLNRKRQSRASRLNASNPVTSPTAGRPKPPMRLEPTDSRAPDNEQDSDTLFSPPSTYRVSASDSENTPSRERHRSTHGKRKQPGSTPSSTTPYSRDRREKTRDRPSRTAVTQKESRHGTARRSNQAKDYATTERDGLRRKRGSIVDSLGPQGMFVGKRTRPTGSQRRTSAVRGEEHPGSRASTAQAESAVCEWCEKKLRNMRRLYCQDCPFHFCLDCATNTEVLYPGHDSTHRCDEVLPGTGPPSRLMSQVSEADEPGGQYMCGLCCKELRDIRYECLQCADFYLCEDHRKLHYAGHVLEPRSCRDPSVASCGDLDAQAVGQPSTVGDKSPEQSRWGGAWSETSSSEDGMDNNETDSDRSDGRRDAEDHDSEDEAGEQEGDHDSWDVRESIMTPPRRSPRRLQPPPDTPNQVTITMPMEGYLVFKAWAEAILAQSPAMESSPGRARKTKGQGSGRGPRRPWLPEDRTELRRLKEQGHADAEVARIIGRSPSAVAQQWRKQK